MPHSVCRAEQYRVKHILYQATIAMTDEVKKRQQSIPIAPDLINLTTELKTLVALLDFVLHEEFVERHQSLRPLEKRSANVNIGSSAKLTITVPPMRQMRRNAENSSLVLPSLAAAAGSSRPEIENFACDFCHADIFITFFECLRCREDSEDSRLGSGLILCPTCYVEGRICACGSMNTRQCRPFSEYLNERNKAAKVYNSVIQETEALAFLTDEYDVLFYDQMLQY